MVQNLISVDQTRRRAFGEECCGHEQPFPLTSRAQPVKRYVSSLASCMNCMYRISNPDLALVTNVLARQYVRVT